MNQGKVSEGDVFHPGERVPVSGINTCTAGCEHRFSTDVKSHRVWPMREGCSGSGWKLITKVPSGQSTTSGDS